MRRPRLRLTVRGMMIVVALVGINLSAVRLSAAIRMRRAQLCGAAAGLLFEMGDGRVLLQPGRKGNVFRVVQPATASGLCRTWWPTWASAGLTALALGLTWRARRPPSAAPCPSEA